LTAFTISSIDMKIVMPFFRVSTPQTPIEKRIALSIRK